MSAIINLSKESHRHCFLCGCDNPLSLKLKFNLENNGSLRSSFKGNENLQGYEGILHGGIISSLLDSIMTNCLAYNGIKAVTGELLVRYLKSIPYDAILDLKAWIIERKSRLILLESEVSFNNELMAWGSAKFMKI